MAIRCGCCGGEHATAAEVRACCAGELRAAPPAAPPVASIPPDDPPITTRHRTDRPTGRSLPAGVALGRSLAELAGPDALGRSLVVASGQPAPEPWVGAPRVVVDERVLADPGAVVAELRPHVLARRRVVIELAVEVHEPAEVERRSPHELGPDFELPGAALHHLVWANSIDARRPDEPRWAPAELAVALGARAGGGADIVLPNGTEAWCDGGPLLHPDAMQPSPGQVVHRIALEHGSVRPLGSNRTEADLAPDQLAAVTHAGGTVRIIAPAGSGKTRVLTERARLLLAGWDLPPGAACLVAFNKRAQEEMVARTPGVVGLRVRTLNALGLAILNGDGPFAGGRPRVTTIGEPDVRRILDQLVRLPKRRNVDPMATWLEALTVARLGLQDPTVVERSYGDDTPDFAAVHAAYRARLRSRDQVDFDEQILGAIELLLTDPAARAAAQRACRLLLVDEFQDLTPAHLLLVRLLAAPAYEVTGVGDDDQTIYGYNGADPTWLIEYGRFFPGAADHPLEVNYRCPSDVVDGAAMLLRHNRRRVPKAIRARADAPSAGLHVVTTDEPPRAAVDRVVELLAAGAQPDAIAVLARVNVVLAPVQVALAERGVPVRTAVGPELLERTAVRSALAWLRVAGGQWSAQDLRDVVRRPSRSMSPRVGEWVLEQEDLRALRRLADRLHSEKDAAAVGSLADDLEALTARLQHGALPDVLRFVVDDIGLAPAVAKLDSTRHGRNATAQADDLDALAWLAALHPATDGFEAWLRAALTRPSNAGGVTLASVHKVKGQEWPHVVVHEVDRSQFPHRLADDVEEERRVFHVAITRAIESVTLVATATPSPFVAELTTEPSPSSTTTYAPTPRTSTATRSTSPAKDTRVLAAVGVALVDQGVEWRITQLDTDSVLTTNGRATRAFRVGRAVLTAGGRRGPLAMPTPADPDGDAIVTADVLRRLRRRLADGKPAYTVFDDKTLDAIVAARPVTLRELGRVKGIGPAKLEAFGDQVLAALVDPGSGFGGGGPTE